MIPIIQEEIKLILKKNKIKFTDKDFESWFKIVSDILNNEEFQKRKKFKHHEKQTVYEHSVAVSFDSYLLAKKHKADKEICAIAGLLHDFYTAAWQYSKELDTLEEKYKENFLPGRKRKKLLEKHGFTHPLAAIDNASYYFPNLINEKVISAIATHMFPLSLMTKYKIPKYKESWIITFSDKRISKRDFPSIKEIPKYLGLKRN